jgi:hypothetical protein
MITHPGSRRDAIMRRFGANKDRAADNAVRVERREAQRPGGGLRNPAVAGRARLGMGFATPSRQPDEPAVTPQASSVGAPGFPIARETQKGLRTPLAPPGAPFPFGEKGKTGQGNPRPHQNGRRSVGFGQIHRNPARSIAKFDRPTRAMVSTIEQEYF